MIAGGVALKDSIESYWRANDIVAIEADQKSKTAAEDTNQKAHAATQEAASFYSKIADYAAKKWDTGTTKSQGTKPTIKKIVIVNVDTQMIEEMNHPFQEGMRARTHQEVDAVVLIQKGGERVGSYSDGTPGMRKTVSVSAFLPNGYPLCPTKKFKGSEPPQFKSGLGGAFGEEPREAVISYIKSCIGNTK